MASFQISAEASRLSRAGVTDVQKFWSRLTASTPTYSNYFEQQPERFSFLRSELARFNEGASESSSLGAYRIAHSFDTLPSLQSRFPDYETLIVFRDPTDRIRSTIQMFWGGADENRTRQRIRMGLDELEKFPNLLHLSERLHQEPNCHFNSASAFFEHPSLDPMVVATMSTPLSDLDSWVAQRLRARSAQNDAYRNSSTAVRMPKGDLDDGFLNAIDERFTWDRLVQNAVDTGLRFPRESRHI